MVAGNGATAIHDFELGLIGETSEYVPQALEKGEFGMAYEFNYINAALIVGDKYDLGYGESVGKMICDESFRREVEILLDLNEDTSSPCLLVRSLQGLLRILSLSSLHILQISTASRLLYNSS